MRCFSIKQELIINERIRADKVQLIAENGEKLGIKTLDEALDLAADKKLDVVLVSPNAEPPVCKLMNYGKYKFERSASDELDLNESKYLSK